MWEDVRSNDVIHLQRYKLEGTAVEGMPSRFPAFNGPLHPLVTKARRCNMGTRTIFSGLVSKCLWEGRKLTFSLLLFLKGLFNTLRLLYSEAPNYRIIVVNSPYWEFANGHTEEALQTLFDWIVVNVLAKLFEMDFAGFAKGDTDRKIRITTDFMKSYIHIYGTLHKLPLSENDFQTVLNHMAESNKHSNMPYHNYLAANDSTSFQSKVVQAPQTTSRSYSPALPPTTYAPQPLSVSQLTTVYQQDPTTGQVRQIQVYRPVQPLPPPSNVSQPSFYQPPTGPIYAPAPSYTAQPYGPRSTTVYAVPTGSRGPPGTSYSSSSSSAAHAKGSSPYVHPSAVNGYPGQSSSSAPNYAKQAVHPGLGQSYVQQGPNSSYVLPPPASQQNTGSLPVSDWDAKKPGQPENNQNIAQPSQPTSQMGQQGQNLEHSYAQAPPAAQPQILPFTSPQSAPPPTLAQPNDDQRPSAPASEPEEATKEAPISAPSPARSPAPKDDDEDKNLCKICFERDLDCALLPCSHVTCHKCAVDLKLTKCPFCRQDVTQILKLYRA